MIHERLHGHDSFQPLLKQNISHQGYIRLLKRLLGYHLGFEASFEGFIPDNRELTAFCLKRSDRLRDDLLALQQSKDQIESSGSMSPLTLISTDAALLGSLYVREGALIGGRSLSRNLDHLLGDTALGRGFFLGAPEDIRIWRGLCGALNSITAEPQQDQVIQAAQATFALFHDWMDGLNGVEPT
jgi:heme oxygenase